MDKTIAAARSEGAGRSRSLEARPWPAARSIRCALVRDRARADPFVKTGSPAARRTRSLARGRRLAERCAAPAAFHAKVVT